MDLFFIFLSLHASLSEGLDIDNLSWPMFSIIATVIYMMFMSDLF